MFSVLVAKEILVVGEPRNRDFEFNVPETKVHLAVGIFGVITGICVILVCYTEEHGLLADEKIAAANIAQTLLHGWRLLEVTDFFTDVAIAIILLPFLPLPLMLLDIIALTNSLMLLALQSLITNHDSRSRKYRRLTSVATLFLVDAILIPLNFYGTFHGAPFPFEKSFSEISETCFLIFGLAVSGAVVVAKLTTVVYEALYLEKMYEGNYNPLLAFLKEERGPQPTCLLLNDLWGFCAQASQSKAESPVEADITL